MNHITQLAHDAITRSKIEDFKIEVFLMELSEWNKFSDENHLIPDPKGEQRNQFMGIPVEVLPNLMQCVERSIALAFKGRVAWILNPDPFSKIDMKPAFDAGEVMPS